MKTSASSKGSARISRRGFLGGCAGAALAAAGGPVYARYVEPGWLRTAFREVPIAGLPSEIRIAHLSDFHASAVVSVAFIADAIARAVDLGPDLICLTGDYVTHHQPGGMAYGRALAELAVAAPTYAIFGNHDGGAWAGPRGGYATTEPVAGLLRDAGIHVLDNGSTTVSIRDQSLGLVGVGDLWAEELHPQRAFADTGTDSPIVLMCHNPDAKATLQSYAWDLMLCGHTHGGQIRLPLLGTPFAPVRDHAFVDGLHRWNQRWIHVTRGVGNLHGLRFNCRPEVSLLTLRPVPDSSMT